MPVSRRQLLQLISTIPFCMPLLAQEDLPRHVYTIGPIPQPDHIKKIISAGPPADMLLLAVAPEKLPGFSSFDFSRQPDVPLSPEIARLPRLGRIAGRASTLSLESLVALAPDLIVDCGNTDESWLSQARRVYARSGIPWVLINGGLSSSAQQLLTLGEMVGNEERARQQAALAQRFIDDAEAFATTSSSRLRFYAARGAKGLETGLAGSLHTEVAEMLGMENVARVAGRQGIARVSLESILRWQPDIVLTQDNTTYQHIIHDPAWQTVKAVAGRRVLLLEGLPFGWLDAPPGINRLAGLRRLHAWLDPHIRTTLQASLSRFSELFWHNTLSAARYSALMSNA